MATKKNNRSSKTDHVLSLLSNSSAPEPVAEEVPAADAPTGEPAATAAPASPAAEAPSSSSQRLSPPILEVARTNNEALEEAIHQALEAAFEEDMPAPPAPPAEPMPPLEPLAPPETASVPVSEAASSVPTSSDTSEPQSMEEAASIVEPASLPVSDPMPSPTSTAEPEPIANPVAPALEESTPEPDATASVVPSDPEAAATLQILPDGSRMINVMEYLVSQKVEYYARMFQLCCCPRCLADSMALALSRLPAKYVVLPEASYRPMLSFLEAKFDSMVTAQVIYACKQVLEVPRHNQ